MSSPDAEFHDFVLAFADPLTRLAYLLVAERDSESADPARDFAVAEESAFRSLARVRAHWRDARAAGAAESLAIEELLNSLPRLAKRSIEPWITIPTPQPSASQRDEEADAARIHEALWEAWRELQPRERVLLLFADPGVASARLAGAELPHSFGSARHRDSDRTQAARIFENAARGGVRDCGVVAVLDDAQFWAAADDALRERAHELPAPIDPFARVEAMTRRGRRKSGLAGVAVLALVVSGVVAGEQFSHTRHEKAAASGVSPLSRPASLAAPHVAGAASVPAHGVVDWPVRGSAKNDPRLLVNLRAAFVGAHPDAFAPIQVLAALDTPQFRVAYVTAASTDGVVQSWFYGPRGSDDLTEGASSYGGSLLHTSVIAAAVADPAGHDELVVIAPPETTDVQLGDFDFSKPPGPGFVPIVHTDGIAVTDVSRDYVPALLLQVHVRDFTAWQGPVPIVQLGGAAVAVPSAPVLVFHGPHRAPSASPSPVTPMITVERGHPDIPLLRDALTVQRSWEQTGALPPGEPVVLWGGTDPSGSSVVVLRVKTLHLADLLVVVYSDAPSEDVDYRLAPDAPDFPLAFVYHNAAGSRVGVLTPLGVTNAAILRGGGAQTDVGVDATGFASIPAPSAAELQDPALRIALYDQGGRVVATLKMPSPV